MKAYADKILVRPMADEKNAEIFIYENTRQRPNKGIVELIGKDVLETKVGDTVIYGNNAGTEVTIEGEKKVILREAEIFLAL